MKFLFYITIVPIALLFVIIGSDRRPENPSEEEVRVNTYLAQARAERYIKDNVVKHPDTFQEVGSSELIPTEEGWLITYRFKADNSFGVTSLSIFMVHFDKELNVVRVVRV